MDAGQMVEFDHPHILLQKEDGVLRGMVEQTGRSMADTLARIAQQVISLVLFKSSPKSLIRCYLRTLIKRQNLCHPFQNYRKAWYENNQAHKLIHPYYKTWSKVLSA
jgi:hypothetical protein